MQWNALWLWACWMPWVAITCWNFHSMLDIMYMYIYIYCGAPGGLFRYRLYFEVKSKWHRSELEAKPKWNLSEIEVASNWHRHDIEAKPKWNRSDLEVKSKWHLSCKQLSTNNLISITQKPKTCTSNGFVFFKNTFLVSKNSISSWNNWKSKK